MPDISLCRNTRCPSCVHCYRFRARPSDRQSYCGFTVPEGQTKCSHYWSTSGYRDSDLTPKVERTDDQTNPNHKEVHRG
jgi:hypothetical protein